MIVPGVRVIEFASNEISNSFSKSMCILIICGSGGCFLFNIKETTFKFETITFKNKTIP